MSAILLNAFFHIFSTFSSFPVFYWFHSVLFPFLYSIYLEVLSPIPVLLVVSVLVFWQAVPVPGYTGQGRCVGPREWHLARAWGQKLGAPFQAWRSHPAPRFPRLPFCGVACRSQRCPEQKKPGLLSHRPKESHPAGVYSLPQHSQKHIYSAKIISIPSGFGSDAPPCLLYYDCAVISFGPECTAPIHCHRCCIQLTLLPIYPRAYSSFLHLAPFFWVQVLSSWGRFILMFLIEALVGGKLLGLTWYL